MKALLFVLISCLFGLLPTVFSADTVPVSIVIRDFWPATADGECMNRELCNHGEGCEDSSCHRNFGRYDGDGEKGAVLPTLRNGKPVLNEAKLPELEHFTSVEEFDQWYRNVPGLNRAHTVNLTFEKVDDNLYEYESFKFFPIEHQGWGNWKCLDRCEENFYNYHFTTELSARFVYSGGENFEFSGDDDLWVFINGRLAIDLGGVHASQTKEIFLDDMKEELNITVGENYPIHIFHAERRCCDSNFGAYTSIIFQCDRYDFCGVCQGDGTSCCDTQVECNDNDPCTEDSCHWQTGDCIHEEVVCESENQCLIPYCNATSSSDKVKCGYEVKDCDDGNACTRNWCDDNAGCRESTITDQDCDDGTSCRTFYCDKEEGCKSETRDCDDGNPCTRDSCNEENDRCEYSSAEDDCDDNNRCTEDKCEDFVGCVNTAIDCEGSNPCLDYFCDEAEGCGNRPVTCPEDENPCTEAVCIDGVGCAQRNVSCGPDSCTQDIDCQDNNLCTVGWCDLSKFTCVYNTTVFCNQSNLCNPQTCNRDTGECQDNIRNCDDGNDCTIDFCDPNTGSCFSREIVCDPQDRCHPERCNPASGQCEVNEIVCDDNNPCTENLCDGSSGSCYYPSINCESSNPCFPTTCDRTSGTCVNTTAYVERCDDRNLCTQEYCRVEDGKPTCAYNYIECDDGNPCTRDSCRASEGCVYRNITCDDGDLCTEDFCSPDEGGCVHRTKSINNGNKCKNAYCDPLVGIVLSERKCGGSNCKCNPGRGECECRDSPGIGNLSTAETAAVGTFIIIGAAALVGVIALSVGSKKGYDYLKMKHDNQSNVQDNPLYEQSQATSQNPFYDEEGLDIE